jgi:hypothetical protein
MRHTFIAALLFSSSVFGAEYRIDPGASVKNGNLTVAPTVQGPAGSSLRYEIRTTKEAGSGKSSSSQSGSVRLGENGAAKLATTSISVGPQDRYRITVKLLERGRVVAEETVFKSGSEPESRKPN